MTPTPEDLSQISHLYSALERVVNNRVAIDGGANIGLWTQIMASRFSTVHAFEPSPETFAILVENTKDLPNVNKYNIAIGDRHASCGIFHTEKKSGHRSHFVSSEAFGVRWRKNRASRARVAKNITMMPIDAFGFDSVDFIKLDVEGAEYYALAGAEETIRRSWPTIMVEMDRKHAHRFGVPAGMIESKLARWGYKNVRREGVDAVFVRSCR